MSDLNIVRLQGNEIQPYISDLAKLRIAIFKEYPYLYQGDMAYEENYLRTYVQCSESIMVLVFADNAVVGASTAIPLEFEVSEFQKPFLDLQYDIKKIFYLGESVLLPAFRGRNIYRHFFIEREAAAKKYGCHITTFAAVDRSPQDPRRPLNYVPLDSIWNHFGYQKHPELCAYFSWQEIGETQQTLKPLHLWLKNHE